MWHRVKEGERLGRGIREWMGGRKEALFPEAVEHDHQRPNDRGRRRPRTEGPGPLSQRRSWMSNLLAAVCCGANLFWQPQRLTPKHWAVLKSGFMVLTTSFTKQHNRQVMSCFRSSHRRMTEIRCSFHFMQGIATLKSFHSAFWRFLTSF